MCVVLFGNILLWKIWGMAFYISRMPAHLHTMNWRGDPFSPCLGPPAVYVHPFGPGHLGFAYVIVAAMNSRRRSQVVLLPRRSSRGVDIFCLAFGSLDMFWHWCAQQLRRPQTGDATDSRRAVLESQTNWISVDRQQSRKVKFLNFLPTWLKNYALIGGWSEFDFSDLKFSCCAVQPTGNSTDMRFTCFDIQLLWKQWISDIKVIKVHRLDWRLGMMLFWCIYVRSWRWGKMA